MGVHTNDDAVSPTVDQKPLPLMADVVTLTEKLAASLPKGTSVDADLGGDNVSMAISQVSGPPPPAQGRPLGEAVEHASPSRFNPHAQSFFPPNRRPAEPTVLPAVVEVNPVQSQADKGVEKG